MRSTGWRFVIAALEVTFLAIAMLIFGAVIEALLA
jgi:hypothetical protein